MTVTSESTVVGLPRYGALLSGGVKMANKQTGSIGKKNQTTEKPLTESEFVRLLKKAAQPSRSGEKESGSKESGT